MSALTSHLLALFVGFCFGAIGVAILWRALESDWDSEFGND